MAGSDISSTNSATARPTASGAIGGSSSRTQERDDERSPQAGNTGIVNRMKESAAAQLTSQKNRGINALGTVAQAVRSTTSTLRDEKHGPPSTRCTTRLSPTRLATIREETSLAPARAIRRRAGSKRHHRPILAERRAAAAAVSRRRDRRSRDVRSNKRPVTGRASSWPESASQLTSRARDYAADTADSARSMARRRTNQMQRMVHDNPLLVGAGALFLGVAFGLAVPETETENEWMGDARDTVVERARSAAREAADEVQEAASTVVDVAKKVTGKTETLRQAGMAVDAD
jgi:hypothetical protein